MRYIRFCVLCVFVIVLASCGAKYSDSDAKEMVNSFERNHEFTADETQRLVDTYCSGVKQYCDELYSKVKNSEAAIKIKSIEKELKKDYATLSEIEKLIVKLEKSKKLDSSQLDKVAEARKSKEEVLDKIEDYCEKR